MKGLMPVNGRITSKFGKRIDPITGGVHDHNGVDIAVPVGTPIKAPWDGIIQSAYYKDAGGNQAILKHPSVGYTTGYAHLKSIPAFPIGTKVKRGQIFAYSGQSGTHISGPHVHWTMRTLAGDLVDPLHIIQTVTGGVSILNVLGWVAVVLLICLLIYLVVKYRRNKKTA